MLINGNFLWNGLTVEQWLAHIEFERKADYSRSIVIFSCVACKGEVLTTGGRHISRVPKGCTHFEVAHKYAPYLPNTSNKKPGTLGGVRF